MSGIFGNDVLGSFVLGALPSVYDPLNQTLTDPLVSIESYTATIFDDATLSDVLTISEGYSASVVITDSYDDALTISEQYNRIRLGNFNDILTVLDSYPHERISNITLNDHQTNIEQYSRSVDYHRTLIDSLVVNEHYQYVVLRIDQPVSIMPLGTPLNRPSLSHAPILAISSKVILYGQYSAIILPAPEFNDTESFGNKVTIKRSMVGGYTSYVQTSKEKSFKYTWHLGLNKALELKQFLKKHITSSINVVNWKGEVWKSKIFTNPNTLTQLSRFNNELELSEIELQFQGVKING